MTVEVRDTMVTFEKAERRQVKLKLGIAGPSGSGKTLGALSLARNMGFKKVALIDTENESSALYSDRYDFDILNLTPPYTSARYQAAMGAAAEGGYDLLIIDSLSHQWAGDGGILSRKEQVDKRGGNSFTNWAMFTKEHEEFKGKILNAPIHIIATIRSKQDYVMEERGGKSTPKKVGTAPIQREGMEYEFSLVFDVQMDHKAMASKDRTGLFNDRLVDLLDKGTARELTDWLAAGKVAPPADGEQIAVLRSLAKNETQAKKIDERIARGITASEADAYIARMSTTTAA